MLNKVFQVPYGTKDILPGEMKRRRKIENAILDIFENWGYEEVKTPGFEYADTNLQDSINVCCLLLVASE